MYNWTIKENAIMSQNWTYVSGPTLFPDYNPSNRAEAQNLVTEYSDWVKAGLTHGEFLFLYIVL